MAKRPPPSPAAKTPLGPACRIVLLAGPNQFIAAEYTSQLRETCETETGAAETLHFDGKENKAADVLDECRSMGLMRQHKVVVVDNAEEMVKEENRALFERYAQAPAEGATLVLRSTKWRKGKLDDMIAQVGAAVDCAEVSEERALEWAHKRAAKRHNATLEPAAAAALVQRCGPDLGKLDTELAKLAAGAGPAKAGGPAIITADLVAELVGKSREQTAWDFQSAIITEGPQGSLSRLRFLLHVSREPSQLLWWACLDLSRKLHGAAWGLKNGENPFALSRSLKIWGPSQGPLFHAAKQMGPAQAAKALFIAVEADASYKQGLGNAERTLEVVTLLLSDLARPATR